MGRSEVPEGKSAFKSKTLGHWNQTILSTPLNHSPTRQHRFAVRPPHRTDLVSFLRCFRVVPANWEKSRSQSLTFWHIQEKYGFHFLIRKLSISIDQLWPPMKLIRESKSYNSLSFGAKQNALQKYFSRYDFLKIYLQKIQIEFFFDLLWF